MPRLRKTLVIGTAVAAIVGAGAGVAIAATNGSTSPNSQGQQAKRHPGLLKHTEHGEFTERGQQHRVIDVQRGKVQSVSANSITVRSTDGFTATYAIDNATKARKDKKAGTVSQLATGDQVLVFATKAGSTATAKRIIDNTK